MREKLKKLAVVLAYGLITAFGKPEIGPMYSNVPVSDPIPIEQVKYTQEDLYYLSRTIWAEARGEGSLGMLHVGSVILNRVKDSRFPKTIKAVVLQPYQFSVWSPKNPNYGKLHGKGTRNLSTDRFEEAESIAKQLLTSGPINRYLYFESKSLGRKGYTIGNHRFR